MALGFSHKWDDHLVMDDVYILSLCWGTWVAQ